ncbi:hypothetical protein OIO90_005828 [Microbotryomycetes sp. JL221]|nr:hypothetical protein OIO90_005828 [Microbotryomycetes sp. JL221]
MSRDVTPSSTESVRMTPRTSESDSRPSIHDDTASDDQPSSLSTDGQPLPTETSPMLARWNVGQDGDYEDDDDDDDDEGWNIDDVASAAADDSIPPADDSWSEIDHSRPRSASQGRKNRRVYGGGRNRDSLDGGELGPGEVAGMILAATLSPTPLLLPHAAALLGLPLFMPVLFITGALSWFAYVVLGLEGRYCGSRSWPSLASAAFPHRFGIDRFGSLLASLLVFLGSLVRGILATVAAAEVFVDLFISAGGQKWWERVIVVGVTGLAWTVLPLIVLPLIREQLRQRPHATHSAAAALFRLPAYIALFLWPLALFVLGIRLKHLDVNNFDAPFERRGLTFPSPSRPPTTEPVKLDEAMGLSIWGGESNLDVIASTPQRAHPKRTLLAGIAIIVFSLTCHHDAFKFVASLARPSSTAQRKRRTSLAPGEDAFAGTPSNGSSSTSVEGKRNQWPLACALGVGSATLIQLGWALVGYLGVNNGGREGNILSSPSLPLTDGWVIIVRALVLLAIIAQLESNLKSAYDRTLKAIELAFGESSQSVGTDRNRRGSYARLSGAGQGPDLSVPFSSLNWDWRSALARVFVWLLVTGLAMIVCTWGELGQGLVSMTEVSGCILSTCTAFLLPSAFFVALFHLRRPRSIFISDPQDPTFATDALLMRKERQVQQKLSGRRIWQDLLVFGGLLPFSVIVLIRGCVALATKGE